MSATRSAGRPTGLIAALAVLLVLAASVVLGITAGAAGAAPYPPTEPCTVWAARQGTVDDAGQASLTVFGSGLGPTEEVRLVHTASQRTVGYARTGPDGRFSTTVSAPTGPEGETPQISAASPESTCTTPPGTTPPSGGGSGSTGPGPGGNGPGDGNTTGNGGGNGGGGTGSGGNGDGTGDGTGGGNATGTPGTSTSPTGPDPTSGGASAVPSSAPATGATGSSGPRAQADPPRISDLPFTIGLVIAAVLLVLGTLLVLMIARRPDRR